MTPDKRKAGESIKDLERNQFLNCSRENLNISETNENFGKRLSIKLSKQLIFNVLVILIIILGIGIEIVILPNNKQQIEQLREDLNELKRQFYEKNFLNELKSFEKQLYGDDGIETESDELDYQSYEDEDYKTATDFVGNRTFNQILNDSHRFQEEVNLNKTRDKRAANHFHNRHYRRVTDNGDSKWDRMFLKTPRQTIAVHLEADIRLFGMEDEHLGNGKVRHNNGIFKAWNPSFWTNDFGMDKYFKFTLDGKLTVHETGLYFVYAQIHYLDQHDENGFHVTVNKVPIMQCMVYSPGVEHKSRSCFTGQVTFIESGNHVEVKDISRQRYTLFQKDKSFFGLIKIGDIKNIQTTTMKPEA